MARFFFDILAESSYRYDFHGKWLNNVDEARGVAEMVVLDLVVPDDSLWVGGEVRVRKENGDTICVLPIMADSSLAA
jgi:hypothetical protein